MREDIHTGLRWESLDERVQQEDLPVGGKIRGKLIWLRIGASGKLL
jgi:hypothetical protein